MLLATVGNDLSQIQAIKFDAYYIWSYVYVMIVESCMCQQ